MKDTGLGIDRRIGRLGYILSILTVFTLLFLLGTILLALLSLFISDNGIERWGNAAVAWLVVNIPFIVYFIKLTTLRLHDIDRNGLQAFFLFLPFVNFVYIILVLFVPGTEGENKYGYPSKGKIYRWFIGEQLENKKI